MPKANLWVNLPWKICQNFPLYILAQITTSSILYGRQESGLSCNTAPFVTVFNLSQNNGNYTQETYENPSFLLIFPGIVHAVIILTFNWPFRWLNGKESAHQDADLFPGSGRFPREGHGNPLHYSCLESLMDRGAWWATVQGVAKSPTWLNRNTIHD